MRPYLPAMLPAALLAIWVAIGTNSIPAAEPQPTGEQLEFFEKEVRPLLVEHCYSCHSSQAKKIQAGLLLDSRAGLLKGGDSGAAIIPGDTEGSLFIEAVRYAGSEMPPMGKLPAKDIQTLERWVKNRRSLAGRSCTHSQRCAAGLRSATAQKRPLGLATRSIASDSPRGRT